MDASVPAGLCLALYKGTRPGLAGFYNMLGRKLDHGPYSHSELILPEKYSRISASSSYIEGGVRFKHISYSSIGNWDFLPIPDPDDKLADYANEWTLRHNACRYDLKGNLRFASNFFEDDDVTWFCTESNMAMLGYPEAEAFRYGPSHAAVTLAWYFNTKLIIVPRAVKKIDAGEH